MLFTQTILNGIYLVDVETHKDERGFFGRSWCQREFDEVGLNSKLVQCNISYNKKRGTLRGMHYQVKPFQEAKLVRCTMGALYDVVIDLRPDSPTFTHWFSSELSSENRRAVYIPEGFAHGFQTLEDNTEILYQMSEFHHPEAARGIRWDDPSFSVEWPIITKVVSEKDQSYPHWNVL